MHPRGFEAAVLAFVAASFAAPAAQTPVPFPRPGQPPAPTTERPAAPQPPAAEPTTPADEPSEATLRVPIHPSAQFITSYDAGRGQRYYLFGTNSSFAEIVAYYKNVLRERGDEVFEAPAIHMFEVGRFREETMAFPPSVTVKDYAFGGSEGYLAVKPGGKTARYVTVIQIVPAPPGARR